MEVIMSNVRVAGQKFVHKRVRGGNTACGLNKGKHAMFSASGHASCPACHVMPLLNSNPRQALAVALSIPVMRGQRDKVRTAVLAEAMHARISA